MVTSNRLYVFQVLLSSIIFLNYMDSPFSNEMKSIDFLIFFENFVPSVIGSKRLTKTQI